MTTTLLTRCCGAALALAWALLGAAAPAAAQMMDCLPAEAPGYALPKSESRESVVVFIHGLHGDGRKTWIADGSRDEGPVAWPCLVLADREIFRRSNVFLASYRTEPRAHNPTLEEAARQLAHELIHVAGAFNYQHVTIAAHSMGGIVLARMLTTPGLISAEQRQRIRLVMFLGTPALPTEAANICAKFGVNDQCLELGDAQALAGLWRAWDELAPQLDSWCVAENADMWMFSMPPRLRIVPEESAYRPCQSPARHRIAYGLDHSAMVKPRGPGQQAHRDLQNVFAACVTPMLSRWAERDSAEQERLAESTHRWFYGVKDRLATDPEHDFEILSASLADVIRFWYPGGDGRPSFSAASYDRDTANQFVGRFRQQARAVLPSAEVRWARRVSDVPEVIADGAFVELTRHMRESGGLRSDDVALAIRTRDDGESLPILLLRSSPAGAAGPYGLLGVLVVPDPAQACPDSQAQVAHNDPR